MFIRRPEDLAVAVRDARKRLSLTQVELAKRLEVNREWVSRLEAGEPGVGLGLVLRALNEVGLRLTLAEPVSQEATLVTPSVGGSRGVESGPGERFLVGPVLGTPVPETPEARGKRPPSSRPKPPFSIDEIVDG